MDLVLRGGSGETATVVVKLISKEIAIA